MRHTYSINVKINNQYLLEILRQNRNEINL